MLEGKDNYFPQEGIERLKGLSWFSKSDPEIGGNVVDENLWNTVSEIRAIVDRRPHEILYYPGAYADIAFPLALSDATTFIFVDPQYDEPHGQTSIIKTLEDLGTTPAITISEKYNQIDFQFNGKLRSIHLYPQDASEMYPKFKDHPADILLLKNTYRGVDGDVEDLSKEDNTSNLLFSVNPSGSIISFDWIDKVKDFGTVYSKSDQPPGILGHVGKTQVFQREIT